MRDLDSVPGLQRSSGEGKDYPRQYSRLENSMDCHKESDTIEQLSLHMSIESVMPSNHLILCHPLLLLPSVIPSIRFFSNESVLLIRWPKYWSFSFSISPSNKYSGLISFRMDWFDLLTVQGILKSLLQHHNWKSSIVQHSAFFMVQSPYYFIIFSNFLLLNLSHLIQV